MRPTADELIRTLDLSPLPREGGWYRETWRSGDTWPVTAAPGRYDGPRAAATAILYLITADTPSALHKLASPELYCFHDGDAVEMLQLHPGGTGEIVRLGRDATNGECWQALVPGGSWQGSRLVEPGAWALFSVVVAPGFDPADYEHGERSALRSGWPAHAAAIDALTRA